MRRDEEDGRLVIEGAQEERRGAGRPWRTRGARRRSRLVTAIGALSLVGTSLVAAGAFGGGPTAGAAVSVAVGTTPVAEAFDSANGDVYVANETSGTVSVVSGATVTATLTVGTKPVALAVDTTSGLVAVADVVVLLVFAFSEWPVVREVKALRAQAGAPSGSWPPPAWPPPNPGSSGSAWPPPSVPPPPPADD